MALKCPCLHVRGLEFPDLAPSKCGGLAFQRTYDQRTSYGGEALPPGDGCLTEDRSDKAYFLGVVVPVVIFQCEFERVSVHSACCLWQTTLKLEGLLEAQTLPTRDQFVSFFAYINDLAVQCLNAMS